MRIPRTFAFPMRWRYIDIKAQRRISADSRISLYIAWVFDGSEAPLELL